MTSGERDDSSVQAWLAAGKGPSEIAASSVALGEKTPLGIAQSGTGNGIWAGEVIPCPLSCAA